MGQAGDWFDIVRCQTRMCANTIAISIGCGLDLKVKDLLT